MQTLRSTQNLALACAQPTLATSLTAMGHASLVPRIVKAAQMTCPVMFAVKVPSLGQQSAYDAPSLATLSKEIPAEPVHKTVFHVTPRPVSARSVQHRSPFVKIVSVPVHLAPFSITISRSALLAWPIAKLASISLPVFNAPTGSTQSSMVKRAQTLAKETKIKTKRIKVKTTFLK